MACTSYLKPSIGFHPTYKTCVTLDDGAHYTSKDCSLHVAHTLPPDVLIDPYELDNYRTSFTSHITRRIDLESPVFCAEPHDFEVFINVSLSAETRDEVCIDFPMHLRYGRPLDRPTYQHVTIPCPLAFWSCPVASTAANACLASDLRNLSSLYTFLDLRLVELFPINYSSTYCPASLKLPVGDASSLGQVHVGTVCIIIVVFCHCLYVSLTTFQRLQSQPQKILKMH